MSDDAKAEEQKPRHAIVMVGHSVDLETNESAVVIYCVGGNRLSVAGARILAAQITQWADHAEKRNADRPKETMMRFMYRALDSAKQWQHVDDAAKAADPNKNKPGYVRKPYSTEWVVEGTEPGIRSTTPEEEKILAPVAEILKKAKARSRDGRKTKKTKRGRK